MPQARLRTGSKTRQVNEKIALGFGNNIDYEIVWDSSVLEDLIIEYDIHQNELDVNRVVNSERDLVISILAFLQSDSGGERFVASSAIVESFSQRFENKITLGGTSVRAAIAMRKLGYTSALHLVTINDHVRRLLPRDCSYVCSNEKESSYPHLIVQYGKNTRVSAGDVDISSIHPNRIIYHSDYDNIRMLLDESFAALITEAKVLLVSGFNAMQDETLLLKRLESLVRMMASLPANAVVFYEEAGFYEPGFCQTIYSVLADHIDIVSLNEDEMQHHLGRKLDLLNAFQIRDALVELQALIPIPVIVVHTKYWAIAYGENATRFRRALKAGTTLATTRFRYGDDFTAENYREIESRAPREDSAAFSNIMNSLSSNELCCVPVPDVEQSNGTTIGLGDAFVGGFLPAIVHDAGISS